MFRTYISNGEYETEQEAIESLELLEQQGYSTIIKEIKE